MPYEQYNVAPQRPIAPWQGTPAPTIDYGRLGGRSPFNAMQSLIGQGLSPEQAYQAYQQYAATGQGPQATWDRYTWGGGTGRLTLGPTGAPTPATPPSQPPPQPGPGSTGFNLGAAGTPYARTPFYLEPRQATQTGAPTMVSPVRVPPVGGPAIPTELRQLDLLGGGGQPPAVPPVYGGLTAQQAGQAAATGQDGMYAGATPAGAGMLQWMAGTPGQTRQQNSYDLFVAQGMDPGRARGIAGWTGGTPAQAAALSWQNDPRFAPQAAAQRQGLAANQASIGAEAGRLAAMRNVAASTPPRPATASAVRPAATSAYQPASTNYGQRAPGLAGGQRYLPGQGRFGAQGQYLGR